MTRDHGQIVHLAGRDWLGIMAISLALLGAVTTQYLRHDRLLTEVLVRQAGSTERMESIERAVERLEASAMVSR